MKLIKLKNSYKIIDEAISVEFGLLDAEEYATKVAGIDPLEFQAAVHEMEKLNHDTAYFGVNGLMTHTANSILERNVVAEMRAIKELRKEFDEHYRHSPTSYVTRERFNRLMMLYMTVDVDAVLALIGDDKEAA